MAIIFADIFSDINKVYEHMQSLNKTTMRVGNTYYSFCTMDDNSPTLRLKTNRSTTSVPSDLMRNYICICKSHKVSSELTKHEQAIIRTVYKNAYLKFTAAIDNKENSIEKFTKIKSDLKTLETQLLMIKSVKKIEKVCPKYIKICGVVIPLCKTPKNPIDELMYEIERNNDNVQYYESKLKKEFSTAAKQNENICEINSGLDEVSRTIENIKDSVKALNNGTFSWEADTEPRFNELQLGAMNPFEPFTNEEKFAFEPDTILGTGDTIHKILKYNGIHVPTNRWGRSFLVDDLNAVLVLNGINTNPNAPLLSKEELEKSGKISQIFGMVKVIEPKIAQELYEKRDKTNYINVRYSLTDWLERLKAELRNRGIDPETSVL